MIVELFGPPGAGKTTFARALKARLEREGVEVELHLSARPGEDGAKAALTNSWRAPLSRLTRPALEMLAALQAGEAGNSGGATAGAIIAALPRQSVFGSLRMRQYLIRLAAAWRRARAPNVVAIFDQAFVQALSSGLLAKPDMNEAALAQALGAVPRSDLAIRILAPLPEIEARLHRRGDAIGLLGRLFETKEGGAAEQIHVSDRLYQGLATLGRAVSSVSSGDENSLVQSIELVTAQVMQIRAAKLQN